MADALKKITLSISNYDRYTNKSDFENIKKDEIICLGKPIYTRNVFKSNKITEQSNRVILFIRADKDLSQDYDIKTSISSRYLSAYNEDNGTGELYRLDANGGASDYFLLSSSSRELSTNEALYSAVRQIESIYYNIIVQKKTKGVYWSYFDEKNNFQGLYCLEQYVKGAPVTTLDELKRLAGADSNNGNGFFLNAGVYQDGKKLTDKNIYFVIQWDPKAKFSTYGTGHITSIGFDGDVLSDLKSITAESNPKKYIFGKIDPSVTCGYKFIKGGQSSQVSLNDIIQELENGEYPLNNNSPTNQDYGDNSITVEKDPITGVPTNTTIPREYITNFSAYKLKFRGGMDERQIVNDFFDNEKDKYDINKDTLIIKPKIHKEQFSISSKMILTDTYYSYLKMNDTVVSIEEFFKELDSILDLKLGKGESGWNSGHSPISEDSWERLPMTACAVLKKDYEIVIKNNKENKQEITIDDFKDYKKYSLSEFILNENRKDYYLLFFDVKQFETGYIMILSKNRSLQAFLEAINPFIIYKNKKSYNCNLSFSQLRNSLNLYSLELMEAYTRGHDFIQENYTTVRAKEIDSNNKRVMSYNDNYFTYKYSGRDFDIMKNNFTFSNGIAATPVRECDLLLETDVTLGDAYGHNKYFIEYIKYGNNEYKDTFKIKDYLEAIDATKYTEDDLKIITSYIDLNHCEYYNPLSAKFENGWSDCCYGTNGEYKKECVYQKLGYCPYRFSTEKHPRRIRTLAAEKSNRFNIIQELSKVFEIYPQFYIEFDKNGKVILDDNGKMKKHVFFITEKGNINQLGFRYEKNLKDISRTVDSSALTTKLFVADVDSELSKTGLCSIQTAEDNLSKTSYILDFSYYTKMGILNAEKITRDLFGIEEGDFAFLPTIGYYNTQYDKLSNLIINLTGETMTQLEAENITNIEGVTASLVEKQKISQQMYQFKVSSYKDGEHEYTISDTYKNYLTKMKEQSTILWGLIETLFFTGDYFTDARNPESPVQIRISDASDYFGAPAQDNFCKGEYFWRLFIDGFEDSDYVPYFSSWEKFKEEILDKYLYPINGKVGQYADMKKQVNVWKKERAKWLNKINDISEIFYKKYEPFLKEGTWTDDNYLTDNEYYWAAVSVLNDSSQPKITYNISVIDLSTLDKDYNFDVADTSYVEDIDFFGISQKTGLPNKQKVLISSVTDDLDNPMNNSIEVKNYTSSFDELFESISASVQSLTFNENTYKRASNFTATKYISKEALQGTLFDGDITLVDHYSENIVMDDEGVQGKNINNTALGYKLNGEGLLFTKDNGQTWDIGVGPNGINADYIKFGQLDASKIQIVDGNYIYFLWDKDGLNAYRNPATSTNGLVDFARFNKYGLSLIENNNVRLRAGYEFKNDNNRNYSGDYKTELDLIDQNIGFYLYNDKGQAIFKTETASDYSGEEGDYSARLSLTGEMFITNKVLDGENTGQSLNTVYVYNYNNALAIEKMNAFYFTDNERYTSYYNEFIKTQDINGLGTIVVGKTLIQEEEDFYFEIVEAENLEIWTDVKLTNKNYNIEYQKTNQNSVKKLDPSQWAAYAMSFTSYEITKEELNTLDIQNGRIYLSNILAILENRNGILRTGETLYLFQSVKTDTFDSDVIVYEGSVQQLMFCTAKNTNASLKTYSQDQNKIPVEYYDIVGLSIGNEVEMIEQLFYFQEGQIDGIKYNYWRNQEYTGESFETDYSDIETQEVGIFINNKAGLQDEYTISPSNEIQSPATYMRNRSGGINIYADDFIIIGDSITNGLNNITISGETFKNAYGVIGAGFSEETIKIENIPLAGKKNLAFFLGMNDPYEEDDTDETYVDEYLNLISNVAALAEEINSISVVSIIAADEKIIDEYKEITNVNIEKRNNAIKSLAEKTIQGVPIQYIDIYTISKNYEHSDRVHLSSNGNISLLKSLDKVFNNEDLDQSVIYNPDVKEAAAEAQAGAERVFTIALKGKDSGGQIVYNNIITVLKNGYLYMGGELLNYYGKKLNMKDFKLLPDKIRVSNPQFILSNSGYMWMDWGKMYQISDGNLAMDKSLLDMITTLGSMGSSSYTSGYYLIDPLS